MAKRAIGRLSNVPLGRFFSRGKGVAKIFDSKTVNVLGHVALNRGHILEAIGREWSKMKERTVP